MRLWLMSMVLLFLGINVSTVDGNAPVDPVRVRVRYLSPDAKLIDTLVKKYDLRDHLHVGYHNVGHPVLFAVRRPDFEVLLSHETLNSEEEAFLKRKDIELQDILIGQRRLLVVCATRSRWRNISTEQLRQALMESEDDGDSTVIVVEDDPIAEMVLVGVLAPGGSASGSLKDTQLASHVHRSPRHTLLEYVKTNPNALGVIRQRRKSTPLGRNLRSLPVSHRTAQVMPPDEFCLDDGYALSQNVYLYARRDCARRVNRFLAFCARENGAAICHQFDLFTFSDQAGRLAAERLRQLRTGQCEHIAVAGDQSLRSVMGDLTRCYAQLHKAVRLRYQVQPADTAVASFLGGGRRYDLLALSSQPSNQALTRHHRRWNSLNSGVAPQARVVAGRAVALIVNARNKRLDLTPTQISYLFTNQVSDWDTIGGTGLKSRAGGRRVSVHRYGVGGPTMDLFVRHALAGRPLDKSVSIKQSSAEVIAAVNINPQAIAYVDYTSIPRAGHAVRVLALRLADDTPPVQLSPSTIRNAMYPYAERVHLYQHPRASSEASDFLQFLTTGGQSIETIYNDAPKELLAVFSRHGLVCLADSAIRRDMLSQFNAMQKRAKAATQR